MKLILAIMGPEDSLTASSALSRVGYLSTRITGAGGFLGTEKQMLMIGVENQRVRDVLSVIEQNCQVREVEVDQAQDDGFYKLPEKVRVGGAAVFVLDVDQFYKL